MKQTIRILSILATILVAGCAGMKPAAEAPPVSDKAAVVALVESARGDAAAGKMGAASVSLERALRIEPRNAALWYELARLRLQQGQLRQAESLAARSNDWAGDDQALRAANWRLIGQARAQRGDYPGAREAFDRAAGIE